MFYNLRFTGSSIDVFLRKLSEIKENVRIAQNLRVFIIPKMNYVNFELFTYDPRSPGFSGMVLFFVCELRKFRGTCGYRGQMARNLLSSRSIVRHNLQKTD